MFNVFFDELLARYDNMVCEQFCKYRGSCDVITDGQCALSEAAEELLADFVKQVVENRRDAQTD